MENFGPNEAKVNITIQGETGDLPQPVPFDATEADIKAWVAECVRAGGVPGIRAQNTALHDYVVDRYSPTEDRSYYVIQVRPKTPFGA